MFSVETLPVAWGSIRTVINGLSITRAFFLLLKLTLLLAHCIYGIGMRR
jgi:hypothetical protein